MSDCRCMKPPFHHQDYTSRAIGVDATKGRFAEVSLETCKSCGSVWLRYFVENEAISGSGRWYRGLVPAEVAQAVTPESALAALEKLEWRFAGGSHFESAGFRTTGPMAVDI